MNQSPPPPASSEIERLIADLDSLLDGERAAAMLVALGEQSIPHLEHALLTGPPRTIAFSRCLIVRALGELGSCSALLSYFRSYRLPADAAVLFAEDAVRSAAATELSRWRSDEVFGVLLDAAKQRVTGGLILALGEFGRPESIPLLFFVLEDDLCRDAAKDALRKMPRPAHQYAMLLIRGLTDTPLRGPWALRRRRATLQLLAETKATSEEWPEVREFLEEDDADVVIAAARIGLAVGLGQDLIPIVHALFRISGHMNFVEEDEVMMMLDAHHEIAYPIAQRIASERRERGERMEWLNPAWRVLRHILDKEPGRNGAA